MAKKSDTPATKKVRKLRPAEVTVRERASAGNTEERIKKSTKVRSLLRRLFGLKVWTPFRVVGRFLSRFLIPSYFKNSFRELKLVTWPNRRQTLRLTFAVIIFSIIFGVIVALADFLLDKLFKKVILNI